MVKVFYLLHVVWCDGLCASIRLPRIGTANFNNIYKAL